MLSSLNLDMICIIIYFSTYLLHCWDRQVIYIYIQYCIITSYINTSSQSLCTNLWVHNHCERVLKYDVIIQYYTYDIIWQPDMTSHKSSKERLVSVHRAWYCVVLPYQSAIKWRQWTFSQPIRLFIIYWRWLLYIMIIHYTIIYGIFLLGGLVDLGWLSDFGVAGFWFFFL